jgi:hypothetical protein
MQNTVYMTYSRRSTCFLFLFFRALAVECGEVLQEGRQLDFRQNVSEAKLHCFTEMVKGPELDG